MSEPKPKSIGDLIFFLTLFLICIAGSIGILLFAVGIEQGNRIVVGAMQSLLENFYLVFFSLLFFNVVIFYIYRQSKSK